MHLVQWIITLAALLSAVLYIGNKFLILFKTWFKFIDDWNGTEEQPGVMKRLEIGSERFDKLEGEINLMKAELFTNGGSSMRDSINRIEKAICSTPAKKTTRKKS